MRRGRGRRGYRGKIEHREVDLFMEISTLGAAGAYLLVKMFKIPAEELGNIAGDWLKCLRIKRLCKIYEDVDAILRAREIIETREIKLKFGIPLLEAASLEDEPVLQQLFVKLLANAMDPEYDSNNIRNAYIDIISGLEPQDAKLLEYCYGKILSMSKTGLKDGLYKLYTLKQNEAERDLELKANTFLVSCYNLVRVGCMQISYSESTINSIPIGVILNENSFNITPLGYRFIEACSS